MICHFLPLLLPRMPMKPSSSLLLPIFVALFFLICPKPSCFGQQTTQPPCLSTGQWGSWGAWGACPQPSPAMSILNIQRRLRQCSGQPTGCNEAAGNYSCPGAYAEVQPCNSTTPSPSSTPPATSTPLPSTASTSTSTLPPTTTTTTTTATTTTTRPPSTPAPSTAPPSTAPSTPPLTPSPTTTPPSTTPSTTTPSTTTSSSTSTSTTRPSTSIFASPNSSVPQQQQPQTTPSNPIVLPVVNSSTFSTTTTRTTTAAGCGNQWNPWMEWSTCTDTCGNCGTRQRFRSCNTVVANCDCSGSAFEKVACNPQVCIYPKATCCGTFTPASVNNSFVCVEPGTVPAISALVRSSISGTG